MSVRYNRGKYRIANSGWPALDVRCLILAGASVPAGAENPDLNTVSELLAVPGTVEAAEVGALTGYVRKTLASKAVIEDDTGDVANLDCADISYAETESGTWRAVVFYVEGASDAARDLISLHTFATTLTTNGGTVSLTVDANGLIGQA